MADKADAGIASSDVVCYCCFHVCLLGFGLVKIVMGVYGHIKGFEFFAPVVFVDF